MRNTISVLAIALLSLSACGGGEGDAGGDAETAQATAPLGTASIAGTVMFSGTPPANPAIDMAEEEECRATYEAAPTDPVVMVSDGQLANVFVRVVGGLPADATFPLPAEPAVIDQEGCLYHPRVLGVMVGQAFEIRNSDPLLHNIKAVPTANRPFNISQPQAGMTTTRRFAEPEVMVPLECNVHGWMNAYVGVVAHPFFATSGEDGRFTISGLPAGTYELEAWHEQFGTQTATVTVADGASGTVAFTFAAN